MTRPARPASVGEPGTSASTTAEALSAADTPAGAVEVAATVASAGTVAGAGTVAVAGTVSGARAASISNTIRGEPTATLSPGAPVTESTRPLTGAGTSTAALSVMTSTMI